MAGNRRSQLLGGIFLTIIGLLFLLNTFNIINGFNWWLLIRLWPVLLILAGLNILLKKTRLWFVVPLLLILVILSLFLTSSPLNDGDFYFSDGIIPFFPFRINIDGDRGVYRSSMGINDDLTRLAVDLSFGGGRLYIKPLSDDEKLYDLNLRYHDITPAVDYQENKEEGTAFLTINRDEDRKWIDLGSESDNWHLYLTRQLPLELQVNAGAGKFNMDLRKLMVKDLTVNVGAGDLDIKFGEATERLELNSGAASVELDIPREMAVNIKTTGILSTNNFLEEGLVKVGNNYRSREYDQADIKLDIFITASASKIELDYN